VGYNMKVRGNRNSRGTEIGNPRNLLKLEFRSILSFRCNSVTHTARARIFLSKGEGKKHPSWTSRGKYFNGLRGEVRDNMI